MRLSREKHRGISIETPRYFNRNAAAFFEAKNVALYSDKRQAVARGAGSDRNRAFLDLITSFHCQPWTVRQPALPFLPFSVSYV